MNFKEFLKPTTKKGIFCLIISFLFLPFISYDNGIRCITAPCPNSSIGSAFFYLLSENHNIYEVLYTNLILGLIVAYVISCAIIIGFRKMRKKK